MKQLFFFSLIFLLTTCQNSTLHSPNEVPGYDNHQSAGKSAHDYLADEKFHTTIIEIQAVEGFEPTEETKNNLQSFLETRLNKSGGIQIVVDASIPSPGKSSYSLSDVRKIENDNRLYFTADDKIYGYFLFLDGASTDDTGSKQVLGYAHQNTSIVIFEETIHSLAGGLTQPPLATVESTVMEHEFGHLMGLVNIGSPIQSQHLDSAHGNHCTVTSCLMYYLADTSDIISNLLGGSIPDLDNQCIQDLQANGGK